MCSVAQDVFSRAHLAVVQNKYRTLVDWQDLQRLERFLGQPVPPEPCNHRTRGVLPWPVACLAAKL